MPCQIHSPPGVPRVAPEFGLVEGWNFDITAVDENGDAWDCAKRMRKKAPQTVRNARRYIGHCLIHVHQFFNNFFFELDETW